jgi:hypothetical protein
MSKKPDIIINDERPANNRNITESYKADYQEKYKYIRNKENFILHLDSVHALNYPDRNLAGNILTSSFTYQIAEAIILPDNELFEFQVCLLNASIPYTWQLIDDRNDTIFLEETTFIGSFPPLLSTVKITQGNYDNLDDLAFELSLAFNRATQIFGNVYDFEYSKRDHRFTMTFSNTQGATDQRAILTFPFDGIGEIIGFTPGDYTVDQDLPQAVYPNILLSNSTVTNKPEHHVYIRSNLYHRNVFESSVLGASTILSRVGLGNVSRNSIVTYEAPSPLFIPLDNESMFYFRFYLTDKNGELLDLRAHHWSLSIQIVISKKESLFIE